MDPARLLLLNTLNNNVIFESHFKYGIAWGGACNYLKNECVVYIVGSFENTIRNIPIGLPPK